MVPSFFWLLSVLLAVVPGATAIQPRILADTNRDGVVSLLDSTDKHTRTARRRAISLPNVGDSLGRCAVTDLTGAALSNHELWRCHDAYGDRLLPSSARYTAPLLTLGMPNLFDYAIERIYTEPGHTRDRVRLFWNETHWSTGLASFWSVVDRQVIFNATSLRNGISLLRGAGTGGFQPGSGSGFGWEEINSGGNIETIPPYNSRSGKRWPSGRVIMGSHFGTRPAESMVRFLQSQGAQSPLFLETGWLAVGHVDEMNQFLPANTTLGFTLAIADTISALSLLRTANASGYGSTPLVSYTGDATPDALTPFLDPALLDKNTTIASTLSDPTFHAT